MNQAPKSIPRISLLFKFTVFSVLVMLTVWVTLPREQAALAQGPEPEFDISVAASADGSSQIDTGEAKLDGAYFGSAGELAGLEATANGLTVLAGNNAGTYTSPAIASPLANTTDLALLWQTNSTAKAM